MSVTSRFARDLEAQHLAVGLHGTSASWGRIAAAMEEQEALIERLETGIRDLLRENQRRAESIQQQNQTIIALIGERVAKGVV